MSLLCDVHHAATYQRFLSAAPAQSQFRFEATRMDANQVAERLAQTGLSKEEKQAVIHQLVLGSIKNPNGWIFLSDLQLTDSLRIIIQKAELRLQADHEYTTAELLTICHKEDGCDQITIKYVDWDAIAWLKVSLPRRVFRGEKESEVDLSMPVEGNPFFIGMKKHMKSSGIMDKLLDVENWTKANHMMIVGSSGCGKTTTCHALAAEQYVVILECPSYNTLEHRTLGYRLKKDDWANPDVPIITYRRAEQLFFAELAARLLVLIRMLELNGKAFTPLQWLLFVQSKEGSDYIVSVHDQLRRPWMYISSDRVEDLLNMVVQLSEFKRMPVVVVDELQALHGKNVIVAGTANNMPLMKALLNSALLLSCPFIWSGTRMGLQDFGSLTSGVARAKSKELLVLGDFQYLTREDVRQYLVTILDLSAVDDKVTEQLTYLLQGRGRLVTQFVSELLVTEGVAMQNKAVLTTEAVQSTLETFVEEWLIGAFAREINYLLSSLILSKEAVGHMWCLCMLSNGDRVPNKLPLSVHRFDSLAFTSSVRKLEAYEFEDTSDTPAMSANAFSSDVKYQFECRLGEPGLRQALLECIRNNNCADSGILALLNDSRGDSSSCDAYLTYAVALSLVNRCEGVLKSLCATNVAFNHCGDYELQLSRVVEISNSQDKVDWLELVLSNPNSTDFKLLPGVPVKNIVLLPCKELSDNDVICVAVRKPRTAAAVETADERNAACGEDEQEEQAVLKELATPTKKRCMTHQHANSTPQELKRRREITESNILFVLVACANNETGLLAKTHNDQVKKVQFDGQFRTSHCKAAAASRDMPRENEGKYDSVRVLVELAQRKKEGDYVLVTRDNASVLFTADVVNRLCSTNFHEEE